MHPSKLLKRLQHNRVLQVMWSILFSFNTVLLVLAGLLFSFLTQNGFYRENAPEVEKRFLSNMMLQDCDDAMMYFHLYRSQGYSKLEENAILATERLTEEEKAQYNPHLQSYIRQFQESNTNFFFKISNGEENLFWNYFYTGDVELNCVSKDDFIQRRYRSYFNQEDASSLVLSGFIKKNMTVKDKYWYTQKAFNIVQRVRYVLPALLILLTVLEGYLSFVLFGFSGRQDEKYPSAPRAIDKIPLYLVGLIYAPIAGNVILSMGQKGVSVLNAAFRDAVNWDRSFDDISRLDDVIVPLCVVLVGALILAIMLQTFLTTLAVRLKKKNWWQQSLVYRVLRLRNFDGLRIFLSILVLVEIIVSVALIRQGKPLYVLLCDMVFTAVLLLLVFVVSKDVAMWLVGTRRIVRGRTAYIPTEMLTGETKTYADNINFLSRSANAQMEKRYINESFSIQLINGISDGLRIPLSAVSENVEKLESGTLSEEEESRCAAAIDELSKDLKKTIEDLILISKATTGNLDFEPVPTEAGMMVDMICGEFIGQFSDNNMELVSDHPEQEAMMHADGQLMWYIFDGILSMFLQKGVPGTRVYLQVKYVNGQVMILFRGCVRPGCMDSTDAFTSDGGMGLPTAKVFTELQGGTFRHICRQDILQIVMQFPMTDAE